MKRKKKTPSQSRIFLLILCLALAAGLIYFVRTFFVTTPPQVAVVGSPTGSVSLDLVTDTTNLALNQEASFTLSYNSLSEHLTGIQAEITYDPTRLSISNFSPSSSFPSVLQTAKVENGKISFAYGVPLESGGLTGSGTVATFKAKALKVGSADLTFSSNTLTTTTEKTDNTLKSVSGSTLTITDPSGASSAPSSSPTQSLSPSANPSSSPRASRSPSPSPSPSNQSVIKPASPGNLRYNCYDNGNKITLRWDEVSGVGEYLLKMDADNNNYDVNETVTGHEKELSIHANTKYSWTLNSRKSGVTSDEVKVEFTCSGSSNATATPTATPTPTPAASKKPLSQVISNLIMPKASATPNPA